MKEAELELNWVVSSTSEGTAKDPDKLVIKGKTKMFSIEVLNWTKQTQYRYTISKGFFHNIVCTYLAISTGSLPDEQVSNLWINASFTVHICFEESGYLKSSGNTMF